jgi:Flp pilus assembly protein TadG
LARDDAGSVLILVPAAVLVLIVLAAITIDAAVVFLGEREVADAAASAANDAVAAGLDEASFYENGQLCLSPARVAQVAEASVSARTDNAQVRHVSAQREISETGRPQVTVEVEASVDLILAPAVPGASHTRTVSATSTAVLEQAPSTGAPEIGVTEAC